ncbi:MAG: type II toxin-antitoxin system RelE family toxin [Nitrospiraceae bacterium]
MTFEVLLQPRARKEFLSLPPQIGKKITAAITLLAENPRSHQSIKLSGTEGYRLRVGDYRILYEIDDSARTVTVYRIKHRREVYR